MRAACAGLFLMATTAPAALAELRILTSMPPAVVEPFVQAFRADNPGTEVLVLNKNTNSAIDEVIRGNDRGFDIFWASAPEAFALVAGRQGFAPDCAAMGPTGYQPFAYSSIGWTRRTDSLLFMPSDWDDLLLPRYRGKVGMALPSRSGTTHMMVERFLQVRGWDEGWAYFLRLAENLSTLSARSFGVIDGVRAGRFDIGLTIDFLAATQSDLDFRYGQPVMIFPAQIGVLRGGQGIDAACGFAAFVLSDQGQRMLLQADIRRTPISASLRDSPDSAVPAQVRDALRRSWLDYDADLAQARYWAVDTIFDVFIAQTLPRRRALWTRLRALEGRAPQAEIAALTRELARLPLAEAEAQPPLNQQPGRVSDLVAMTEPQRTAHTRWMAEATRQLDAVEQALTLLEGAGQ